MESITAVLEQTDQAQPRQAGPLDDSDLRRYLVWLELPATARVTAALQAAATRVAEMVASTDPEWCKQPALRNAQNDMRRLERVWSDCQDRDRLAEGRPAGCWCLGIGGRPGHWSVENSLVALCTCEAAEMTNAQRRATELARRAADARERFDRLADVLPADAPGWGFQSLAARSAGHAALAREVLAWCQSDTWLYLWGKVGRGKTGALVCALRWFAYEQSLRVGYINAVDFLERMRNGYANRQAFDTADPTAISQSMHTALSVDVLLVDDLGAERHRLDEPVDWATEKLQLLLGDRYTQKRRTMITSNLDLGQLAEHMGNPRVASRIQGIARVIDVSDLANLRVPK